jgi:hypothetical protein
MSQNGSEKLPPAPLATLAPRAAPASIVHKPGPLSPTPEVETLPPREDPRQGAKRRQAQVVASDDAVEA